jgi:ribosomal protein S10
MEIDARKPRELDAMTQAIKYFAYAASDQQRGEAPNPATVCHIRSTIAPD